MTQTMTRPPRTIASQPIYDITEADLSRQKKIAEAWRAYNDELEKPLKRMPDEPDDNVMSNRIQPIVDAGVDFLFGKELEISLEDAAPKEAQDFLDTCWGEKETRIPLLQEWAMNGAVAGQAFLRIVPDEDGTFELVAVDPSTVCVQTAPQNCKRVLLYCIQYSTTEKINGQSKTVYYREEMAATYPDPVNGRQPSKPTGWTIGHWTQIAQAGMAPKLTGWTPAGPPIDWPYPFAPLFGCQNLPMPNSYWGRPDITPGLIGLNNALNLTLGTANRNHKVTSLLYGIGIGDSTISYRPGYIIPLPTDTSKIVAVPVGGDLPGALAYAADLRSDIDEISHTPGVATGRISTMPRGNLSGVAIELLFMPLQKKTDTKQCTYGKTLIDVSKALLTLNRMPDKFTIMLAWQSPIPHDDLPAIQAAVAKKELGATNTTLLREIGMDPEEEAKLSESDVEMKLTGQLASAMPPAEPGVPPLPGQPLPAPAAAPGQPPMPMQGGKQP